MPWQLNCKIEVEQAANPVPTALCKPFNIDAKLNGAYIALGLLFGDSDMTRTLDISTRAGQDSDCNPSSAGGILGVMLGYEKIPDFWKGGIPAISDRKFNFTDFTYKTIVESTYQRALALAKQNGGKLSGDRLELPVEQPKAAKLELWDDYGTPVERIVNKDPRWKFEGPWATDGKTNTLYAEAKGAAATVEFEGTGAIVAGPYFPEGGKAEVYFDGKLDRTVDVYPDEDSRKNSDAVWHAFGLKPGRHSVRIVVLGEPYAGSKGAKIGIDDVIVYR